MSEPKSINREKEREWVALARVANLIHDEIDRRRGFELRHPNNEADHEVTNNLVSLWHEMHDRAHNAHILAYHGAAPRIDLERAPHE